MSVREWVDEELHRVSEAQLFGEDSAPSGEMDDLDRIDTAEALSIVEAYLRAAREVQGWLKTQLAERITVDGKNFMYGNTLYRVQPKKELVIADLDELVKLLGDDVPTVFRLDAYNLRTTALKKVAEQRDLGDTLDAMVYKRTVEDEWELNAPPVKYWPKYLADMQDGEVR